MTQPPTSPNTWSATRRHILVGGAAVVVNSAGSGRVHAQSATKKRGNPEATKKFIDALEQHYIRVFKSQPSAATAAPFGCHDYDDLLEDGSVKSHADIVTGLKDSLAALDKIVSADLSDEHQNDLEALKGRINGDLLYEQDIQLWRKDPGIYPAIALTAVDGMTRWIDQAKAPLSSEQHKNLRRQIIARLERIPDLLNNGKVNVVKPVPRVFVELAIDNLPLEFFKTKLPAMFAGARDPDLSDFKKANDGAVAAIERYADYLTEQKAELVKPENKDKVTDFYAFGPHLAGHFEHYELFKVNLDQLLVDAVATRARRYKQYEALARRIAAKVIELKGKRNDPAIAHIVNEWARRIGSPKRDEMVSTVIGQSKLLKRFLMEKKLVSFPTRYRDRKNIEHSIPADMTARITDGSVGGSNSDLLDSPPPLEDLYPPQATFPVGVPSASLDAKAMADHLAGYEFNSLLVTTAHEIWPGHYMQYVTALQHQYGQSKARLLAFTLPGNTTCEGWAHYVEQMVVESRLGQEQELEKVKKAAEVTAEELLRLAQMSEALLRDGRLIIGLRMHHETVPMTREAAAKFLKDECLQTATVAKNEAFRAAYDISTMSYAFGKMMVLKLRQDYREKVKPEKPTDTSWLREFHDKFLAAGQMPIKIIRRELMETKGGPEIPMWLSPVPFANNSNESNWFEHL